MACFFYACEVRLFCYFLHPIVLQSLGSCRPNEGKPAFVSFPRVCFKFDAHRRSSTSIALFSLSLRVRLCFELFTFCFFLFFFCLAPNKKKQPRRQGIKIPKSSIPLQYGFFSYLFCHPTRSQIKSKKVRS